MEKEFRGVPVIGWDLIDGNEDGKPFVAVTFLCLVGESAQTAREARSPTFVLQPPQLRRLAVEILLVAGELEAESTPPAGSSPH